MVLRPPTMTTTTTLPPSHPLITELASLRQQLAQYQKSAHQSASQVQAVRHELLAVKDANRALRVKETALEAEVEILRKNPAPAPIPPSSTALTELSLAHRRLSAKLDLTESALESSQLELAASKQEIHRLNRERESDQAIINELRRVEHEREEEIEWEKGERRKAEEQKKLCDLALKEYSDLVHSLDPSTVPPITPRSSPSNVLSSTPDLSSKTHLETPPLIPHTSSESISYLLIGQRGVSQLFNDFVSTLSTREKALQEAQARVDELEHSISVLKDQLAVETALRVTAQEARNKALRDDGSAAKVVERYMVFTQKTHATVHLHLDNLRTRSAATQASLRKELHELREQLQLEIKRSETLRVALDEMGEGFSRETAGRRREIALRLALLAEEEKRERRVENWLDRVRKMRDGAEGAVIEPDILETLLDEGVVAVTEPTGESPRKRSWRGLMAKGKRKEAMVDYVEGSSIARVLLAEELANTLNMDLQRETEQRMKLESERVEWLEREATNGVAPQAHAADEAGTLVFSVDDEAAHEDIPPAEGDLLLPPVVDIPRTPSPLADPSPLVEQLRNLFDPLTNRFTPLQSTLHSLSHSLSTIRSSLPTTPASASPSKSRFSEKRTPLLNLSLRPAPNSDPVLLNILDSIHEVIEDARVDVEIALADNERVFRGFEALLGVEKSGAIQGKNVLADAREYIASQTDKDISGRLEKRVGDVEHDITAIKTQLHRLEGMEIEVNGDGEKTRSIWTQVKYRTVTPTTPRPFPSFPSPSFLEPTDGDPRRRTSSLLSSVGSVGRSFSASIVGAPRRMGSFAGGLNVRANGVNGEPKSPIVSSPVDAKVDDDVE